MKKFLRYFVAMACAGAFFMPSDISASNVKQRAYYKYGDILGAAPKDVWSIYDHNFYGKDGKLIRTVQLSRSLTGDITVNQRTNHIYDEQGRLIESVTYQSYATSPENADNEYAFKLSKHAVNEYYDNGQLKITYTQTWKEKNNAWDSMYKSNYYEYSYNADGSKATEKYWLNYYSGNANKPSRTTTFEYDASGKLLKSSSTGQYESNCYDTEYTYDAQGRVTHTLSIYTKVDGSHYGQPMEEKSWNYEGDLLTSEVTEKGSGTTTRILYDYIDGNPYHRYEYTQNYDADADIWNESTPIHFERLQQDYTGMENLVPEINAEISDANPQIANVKFALPAISAEAYVVKVFRDGEEIKSLTKDDLTAIYDGSKYYSFTDENLKSGEHEYYAQVLTGTAAQTVEQYAEGYISDLATVNVVIPYPEVTDFHIKGYTVKKTWVAPTTDPDTGDKYEGYWLEDYKLVLEWTPLTEEQVEGYNFDRYEIYFKGMAGNTIAEQYKDITTSSATVDWLDRYTEVWLNVKYGEDRVSTEHIAIKLDELTNLSDVDPIPAYGVYYKGGTTPVFAKVDLTKPEEDVEDVYNLKADSQVDFNAIFGGVSVDDTYYAFIDDPAQDGLLLGAFNMTDKKYMQIGTPYTGEVESAFTDMAYDMAAGQLYAVAPTETSSYLYTIDGTTGEAVKTNIALPEYTMFIAAADNSKAYAMAAETGGKFQLYSVDLQAGTYAKVESVSVAGSSNKWSSLLCMGNQLYFNANNKFYTIDLDTKAVTTNNEFKYGMAGLTPLKSTALPKIGFVLSDDEHKITLEQGAEGTVNYFYNANNDLERISEFSAAGKAAKYTKNIFDETGVMTSTEVYEPKADAFGIESMQLAASTTYIYNEDGMLAEKKNSDNTWTRYTYADGKVATEVYGNGATTVQTLTYMYDEEEQLDGQPVMIQSASESNTEYNYVDAFRYDEMGNKTLRARIKDLTTGEYIALETWEYFPNSNIVSAHNICSTEEFTADGAPVVLTSTKYTMVDGDPNHLMSQEFEGENPIEGTAKELVYSGLDGTAPKSEVTVTVTPVEGGVNDVDVNFTLPSMAYTDPYSISIYRDGALLKKLTSGEISSMEYGKYLYTDKSVPNGKHEYYARVNAFGINDIDVPLQISKIVDYNFDTKLPAVSNIGFVKYEQKYVDAEGKIDENATEGKQVNVVTIGWTNPEIPAAYGFTGNHLFLMEGTTPTAAGVVTDATVAQTSVNVGTASTFDIMIQSRYALGVANSDTQNISFTVGIDGIAEDGFTVKVAGKQVMTSADATISVFDLTGARVATAYGERLDLSALNGAYIVTAERDGAVRIFKVVL